MFEYRVLIPKDRVGVLIGEKGKIKRLIERRANAKITIVDEEVTIKSEDSYNAWTCKQVIKAIGRGFNPVEALDITKEGYAFEMIDVMDYARNQKDKYRLSGRVIGEKGKTKSYIENKTECNISIFGKTIGVIGPEEEIKDAVEAVKMLLKGAQTSSVYKFLEKKAKMRIKKELV